MKQHLKALMTSAIAELKSRGELATQLEIDVQIERAKEKQHGDFACNLALMLAKKAQCKPRDLAERIVTVIPQSDQIERITIAGPGFINFYMTEKAQQIVVNEILDKKAQYGHLNLGLGKRVLLEFVSANPTGPLHVGHGRSAAFGASLANLLEASGYKVDCEYYVNDAGRQMDILAVSVWLRYLQTFDMALDFPSNAYKGEYVRDIAEQLKNAYGDEYIRSIDEIYKEIPADEPNGGDKEVHIDALIERAKDLLGEVAYQTVHAIGLNMILDDIRDDLSAFGVEYNNWFSERELLKDDAISRVMECYREKDFVFSQDDAQWFKSRDFGDEKDRVMIRANGQATYFASDAAYHLEKFERGYDHVIDIFGADHHGYVARVTGAIKALGLDVDKFKILLVQFAVLYRGKERVQMSTRSGSFVTLRQLRDDVGNDAARFFYVMRKVEQHMDFDLELAKSQTAENPVFYIQYAHARICSIFRQLEEKELVWQEKLGRHALTKLTTSHELALLTDLARYPEVIETAACSYEPHQLTTYLRELANNFHTYYNAHQFIVDDDELRNARLCLIKAAQYVLLSGLTIIGVTAPETM